MSSPPRSLGIPFLCAHKLILSFFLRRCPSCSWAFYRKFNNTENCKMNDDKQWKFAKQRGYEKKSFICLMSDAYAWTEERLTCVLILFPYVFCVYRQRLKIFCLKPPKTEEKKNEKRKKGEPKCVFDLCQSVSHLTLLAIARIIFIVIVVPMNCHYRIEPHGSKRDEKE